MILENISPFIRFAGKWSYSAIKENVSTYDCRILYLQEGNGKIVINGAQYKVCRGLLLLFQPGTVYSLIPEPDFNAIAVDFDYTGDYSDEQSIIIPVKAECFDPSKAHKSIVFDDCVCLNSPLVLRNSFHVYRLMNELCEEFSGKRMFYLQKSSLMLKNIIYEAARQIYSSNKNADIVNGVIKYISDNYREHITNESIADALHYSAGYLNRIISANTGMTIHAYITNTRIEAALKMLASTDMTISEIAFRTGFYSAAHFSNTFKAITGISPSAYKNG